MSKFHSEPFLKGAAAEVIYSLFKPYQVHLRAGYCVSEYDAWQAVIHYRDTILMRETKRVGRLIRAQLNTSPLVLNLN
jgi:hypothetical protein